MGIGEDPTQHAAPATLTIPGRPPPLRDRRIGDRIDRYVITGALGAGGMGVVWAAHDPELERKVAVKLVRMDDAHGDGRERLLREAKAMAQLAHPAVVPVFDAGTVDDEVFVAMELVEGATLDAALAARPRSWRETVALFVQAGRGLEAAHAAGIVHRDFKPSNVLVGKDGRARVTDFGLARLGEHDPDRVETLPGGGSGVRSPALTVTGTVMGTPFYMAPEQHRGELATALSDQFSFCVALWHALYGAAPFAPAAETPSDIPPGGSPRGLAAALADAVTTGRLTAPPRRRHVPRWLHAVLARGLAREPAARWPSMTALLAAVETGPRRRRRRTTAVVVGAGAAVTAATVVWLVARGADRADRARACRAVPGRLAGVWDADVRARAERAFGATGLPYAQAAWQRVAASLDAYAADWTRRAVDSCEATLAHGTQPEPVRELRGRCFDARLDALRALTAALATLDPTATERVASAVRRLPDLAICDDVAVLRALPALPVSAEQRARADALGGEIAAANVDLDLGRYQVVIDRTTPLVERARALDYPPPLASALFVLGAAEYELRRGDAPGHLEAAATVAERAGDDALRFRALDRLASALAAVQRYDAAKLAAAQAAAVIARLGFRPDYEAMTRMTQAAIAYGQEDVARTLALQEAALDWAQKVAPPDDLLVARTRLALSGTLQRLRRFDEAVAQVAAARPVMERALGADHPQLGALLSNEAVLTYLRGDYAGSVGKYEATIAFFDRVLGPESAGAQRERWNLALALLDTDRDADALATMETGLEIDRRRLGPDHPDVAKWLSGIGDAAFALNRLDRALDAAHQAEAILGKLEGTTFEVARARFVVARVLWVQGKRAAARRRMAEVRATFVAGGAGHAHTVAAIDEWKADAGMK